MNEDEYILGFTGAEVEEALVNAGRLMAGVGIEEFDSSRTSTDPYYKNQLVTKSGLCYICKPNTFWGPWISSDWEETTLEAELRKLRGSTTQYETLTINVKVNTGSGVVVGQDITIAFATGSTSTTVTKQVGEDGKITMLIPIGDVYQIQPSALTGYTVRNSATYTAALESRTVSIVYEQIGTGIYVISDQGDTLTAVDIALWNTDDNDHAFWIKYTDSNTTIYFPKTFTTASKVFCPEYKDFTTITNRSSAALANADFTGKTQADAWYTEATTPDSEGKTYVDLYNEAHSTSITIDGYLPAICYCRDKTVTFKGTTYHGYLPSMGQLRALCDNRELLGAALSKIGGSTFPSLASGDWWSSSECGINYCWILYYGSTDSSHKNYSHQVFAVFDL